MANKRSTIGKDPLDVYIPERSARPEAEAPSPAPSASEPDAAPRPARKEKLTVHLSRDLIERVKNAAYWNPELTIAAIAEIGIVHALEQVEAEHGGPYPPRQRELRGGRPISTRDPAG